MSELAKPSGDRSVPGRSFARRGATGLAILAATAVIALHGIGNGADEAGLVDLGWLAPVRSAEGLADYAATKAAKGDFEGGVQTAKSAVKRLPVSQAVVRNLGEIELASEESTAWGNPTILVAKQLGWRDGPAQARLLMVAAEQSDLVGAIDHIDAVLRRMEMNEVLFSAVAPGIGQPDIRSALVDRIAERPPWRGELLTAVRTYGDIQTTNNFAQLLLELQEKEGGPLAEQEVFPTLSKMVTLDMYDDLARVATPLIGARAEDGQLTDPNFEVFATRRADADQIAGPFDWRKGLAERTVVSVSGAGTDDASLRVASRSRVPAVVMRQILNLSAGSYTFRYRQRSAEDQNAFSWKIECGGAQLGTSAPVSATMKDWVDGSMSFTVPATGCPIQALSLRTDRNFSGGNQRISYSDLRLDKR